MAELLHQKFNAKSNTNEQNQIEEIKEDDLESLINLGCIIDEIKIGDKTFKMKSLNASERFDLSKSLNAFPTLAFFRFLSSS